MDAYRRSAWYRAGRALVLISLGWGAAGFFFVFAVNDGRVWPNAYRFLFVYVSLQVFGLLCVAAGRTRHRAWRKSVSRSSESDVGGAAPKDAGGAA
ncbi:hypothetical protein [Nonomuraea sp. NPDC001699]